MNTYVSGISPQCSDSLQINAAAEAIERLPWYAVRVRSKCESRVFAGLQGKGYEAYVPLYRKHSRWTDRVKQIDCVLFPGYVFCRLDANRRLPVLKTPGVVNVVEFGGVFTSIPEHEIEAVRRVIRSGLAATPWPFLREGQRVRVCHGSLKDVEGVLLQSKGDCRLVISVNLLQRSVSVEIDRDSIEPVSSANIVVPRA